MKAIHPFAYAVIAGCAIAGVVALAVWAPSGVAIGGGIITTVTMAALSRAGSDEVKPDEEKKP